MGSDEGKVFQWTGAILAWATRILDSDSHGIASNKNNGIIV